MNTNISRRYGFMNRILLILTDRKNLHILLIAVILIVISAVFVSEIEFSKTVNAGKSVSHEAISPEYENAQLKNILSSIMPSANTMLFEGTDRSITDSGKTNNSAEAFSDDILKKCIELSYISVYSNEEYLRPIYSNTWKQSYYQGWLFLPRKIISARHCLFTYSGDSSKIFDTEGELGFYPNVSIDNKNYLNLLVYNFDLHNVMQNKDQIILSGTPAKKGVQIISIKNSDIYVHTSGTEKITVHLCTPFGYEIDFQNVNLNYAKQNVADNSGTFEKNYSETAKAIDGIIDVSRQNSILKSELMHYISDSSSPILFQHNGSYQTSDLLSSNIDMEDAVNCKPDINYSISYNNKNYNRPIFHPLWKKYADREWCYIPRKMYVNMKKLFVLPEDTSIRNDLYGELGLFGELPSIKPEQTGLLVYNFSVSGVSMYDNNVLVEGIPSRTGLQLVSIPNTNLSKYKQYAARLVTKDLCELDIDIIDSHNP
jgi:hypothetical protein